MNSLWIVPASGILVCALLLLFIWAVKRIADLPSAHMRLNRIGRRTVICMLALIIAALVLFLLRT